MLAKRIIPCLDVTAGRVVKGVKFLDLRDAGDPVELAERYNSQGADELVFLDITASSDARDIMADLVARTARKVFIPLTVGGGIRTVADARKIILAGADKVSVNTAAVHRPDLIRELSEEFGAQAVVLAIDARRSGVRTWNVYTNGGRHDECIDAVEWARARPVARGRRDPADFHGYRRCTNWLRLRIDARRSQRNHDPCHRVRRCGNAARFRRRVNRRLCGCSLGRLHIPLRQIHCRRSEARARRSARPRKAPRLIIPSIDLMEGKIVQLVQGRDKVLEANSPDEMLAAFAGFPQIQVIDLDAAMGRGQNDAIVEYLAQRATIRAGGGVRTIERAQQLIGQGAYRVIVGTAAFSATGPDTKFLSTLSRAIGPGRLTIALDSKAGRIVVKGWLESTEWTALDIIAELEPWCSGFLCTYIDKEGMMEGTDLTWFENLRKKTNRELIAAGGISTLDEVRALLAMNIHCVIGMSIYTGRLRLEDLRILNEVT